MRDCVIRGEKVLLAYPCLITQICLAAGVMELSFIDEMIEAIHTTDLSLIRDAGNPLSRHT